MAPSTTGYRNQESAAARETAPLHSKIDSAIAALKENSKDLSDKVGVLRARIGGILRPVPTKGECAAARGPSDSPTDSGMAVQLMDLNRYIVTISGDLAEIIEALDL